MKRLLLALLVPALVGISITLGAQQGAPPDIIFTNGKIITVDAQFSIAQAVAVRGDRFVRVGTNQRSRGSPARTLAGSTSAAERSSPD